MKNNNIILKGLFKPLLLFTVMAFSAFISNANEFSILKPDFAFPKNVVSSASDLFIRSMQDSDPQMALLAAMQLNVAERLTNPDSILLSLNRYRDISLKYSTPWREFAVFLQAKLLSDVYSSRRYTFDRRVLPQDSLSAEPLLWSGEQFKSEISKLLSSALKEKRILYKTPISDFSLLITNGAEAQKAGMNGLDFAIYQVIDIISNLGLDNSDPQKSIPFKNLNQIGEKDASGAVIAVNPNYKKDNDTDICSYDSHLTPVDLLNTLIKYHIKGLPENRTPDSEALVIARLKKLNFINDAHQLKEYGRSLLKEYPVESVFHPVVVLSLYGSGALPIENGNDYDARLYGIINEAVSRYPDVPSAPCLRTILEELVRPTVGFHGPEQVLPGMESHLEVAYNNVEECYILLVPITADKAESDNLNIGILTPSGKIRQLMYAKNSNKLPFSLNDTIVIPPLSEGYYAIIPSSTPYLRGIFGNMKNNTPYIINVSRLAMLSASGGLTENVNSENISQEGVVVKRSQWLYVTDAGNNNPVRGAKVTFKENSYNGKAAKKTITLVTDKDGKVKVPFSSASVVAQHKGSRLRWNIYSYGSYIMNVEDNIGAQILTDLPIYHPSDSLKCVIIAGVNRNNILSPAGDTTFKIKLLDANGKEVEEKSVISDEMGQAVTSFHLPANGLTGKFRLEAWLDEGLATRNMPVGSTFVEVADYKAPELRVILSEPVTDKNGERITLSGAVTTYSGMPLPDTEINLDVNFKRRWWRIADVAPATSFSTKGLTDSNGIFNINLGLEDLDKSLYNAGYFTAEVSAMSPSGETATSSPVRFSLSGMQHLQADSNMTIEASSDSISIPVRVIDILDKPQNRIVSYSLINYLGEELKSGEFESPLLRLSSAEIPSGRYKLMTVLKNCIPEGIKNPNGSAENDTLNIDLTIWRAGDEYPPYATSLWLPVKKYFSSKDSDKVRIAVGNSYSGDMIFLRISGRGDQIEQKWISLDGMNGFVEVDSPLEGETLTLDFRGMHNLSGELASVTVESYFSTINLELKPVTFRDRITPGAKEQWRFRLEWSDGTQISSSAIAVMTNAALESIASFNWNPTFQYLVRSMDNGQITFRNTGDRWFTGVLKRSRSGSYNCDNKIIPDWNFWGYNLGYTRIMIRGTRMMNSALSTSGVRNGGGSEEDIAIEESAMEYAASVSNASAKMMMSDFYTADADDYEESGVPIEEVVGIEVPDKSEMTLRSMECPSAFFMPELSVGEDGIIDLNFSVPDFNTTWMLRLTGYDERMRTATLKMESVASKPVMVSTNLPRFLLTGDKAQVTAMVYNNTDESLAINSTLEIIDYASGAVLASKEMTFDNMKPGGSSPITLDYEVRDGYSSLAIRAIAKSEKGSDGEEGLILVLPAVQPISDAYTLYMSPSADSAKLTLPKMNVGDMVTLNYCGNPSWFVLTALSGIISPRSESILSITDAYFSNSVARGIIAANPQIAKSIELLVNGEDGTSDLLSPLDKNRSLKLQSLSATPWVNNADNESQRLASLSSLLDEDNASNNIKMLEDKLCKAQRSDGGFAWFDAMPTSLWITTRVISRLGSLAQSGYLNSDSAIESIVKSAVKFTDAKIGEDYLLTVRKRGQKYPLASEMNYLLDRGNFPSLTPPKGEIAEMQNDMLKRIPEEWRTLSLYDKMTAAIIMKRAGNESLAKKIMESVSQFASYKKDKGMWFDRSSGRMSEYTILNLTAHCLDAYSEIDRGNENIEKLAQYLVLSCQSEDWNNLLSTSGVADLVRTVARYVAEWMTSEPGFPEIRIGGKTIELPHDAVSLAGNIYMNLDPRDVSGKTILIDKFSGGPSWGGVMRQYLDKPSRVKAKSVDRLKIEKSLLPIEATESGYHAGNPSAHFKKGDRIRVTLTVANDSNLDYLMISDRMGAFMQPKDQLTEYITNDGIPMLRETLISSTNFYIMSLPAGKHIFSYEVTADRDGEYSCGISEAQSQYYPMITAHSGGMTVIISE